MKRLAHQGFVALIALLLATSMVAPVAMADHVDAPTDDEEINYDSDPAPNIYAHADQVEIAQHDRSDMAEVLAYYDDNGDKQSLMDAGAEMNGSVTAPVGVNFSKIKDVRYRTFPRLSSESGNDATWTDASNWTKASSTDGSMTITDTTVDGANVSSVKFDADDSSTGATEDYAEANYSRVDITTDATKRVAQVGANVHLDDSATQAEIRFYDSDDDYVAYYVNTSADPTTNETILTNKTDAEAVIAQERIADMTVRGGGDGNFDEIQKVSVRVEGVNAGGTVELFWLDSGAKSADDLAEVERDTDDDGEDELTMIEDKWRSGVAWTTGIDTLPDWTDDAMIYDLEVKDISFPLEEIPDHHNNISLSDHPTYNGGELEGYWTRKVPGKIDLSYTNLTLLAEQTVKSDRYETVEYATDTGSTNLTNVSYTESTSSFDSEGKTVILVSNLNAGEWYAAHQEQALTQTERDKLTSMESAAAMGPGMGSGGGGGFGSLPFIGGLFTVLAGIWAKLSSRVPI